MSHWQILITSLPTGNATIRQRAWRTLKASGAAVLRDGVYLMPGCGSVQTPFERLAADVRAGGGVATVLRVEEPDDAKFVALFDRSDLYATQLAEAARAHAALTAATAQDTLRWVRKLRKSHTATVAIDFFPGEAGRQADAALRDLEVATARILFPDEPRSVSGAITRREIAEYQGRIWATRRRPWVDRLASAWLIRRFIDPGARILWLDSPADCPPDALGFDFDGATFSHTGNRVTFEVLAASFGRNEPALARLGRLVHYLDVGGVQPPEAAGVESVLNGMRATLDSDDQLMSRADGVFDGLLAAFAKEGAQE